MVLNFHLTSETFVYGQWRTWSAFKIILTFIVSTCFAAGINFFFFFFFWGGGGGGGVGGEKIRLKIWLWEGLASWLLFVVFNCVFVAFPCGVLGRVCYLIVSIPDLLLDCINFWSLLGRQNYSEHFSPYTFYMSAQHLIQVFKLHAWSTQLNFMINYDKIC